MTIRQNSITELEYLLIYHFIKTMYVCLNRGLNSTSYRINICTGLFKS